MEILAYPCNKFLKQEPDSSEKMEELSCTRFNATYPIFQKYMFPKAKKMGVCWAKHQMELHQVSSRVIGRYGPTTSPLFIQGTIFHAYFFYIMHHIE
uniref:Uncharacterized protein n=1 Tax=Lactuca sativa TaxID=4236 RepID=A0A9R1UFV1_LACSA|nr:hypothetical protein LSAT_V11C900463890 [Lactuca sativa]